MNKFSTCHNLQTPTRIAHHKARYRKSQFGALQGRRCKLSAPNSQLTAIFITALFLTGVVAATPSPAWDDPEVYSCQTPTYERSGSINRDSANSLVTVFNHHAPDPRARFTLGYPDSGNDFASLSGGICSAKTLDFLAHALPQLNSSGYSAAAVFKSYQKYRNVSPCLTAGRYRTIQHALNTLHQADDTVTWHEGALAKAKALLSTHGMTPTWVSKAIPMDAPDKLADAFKALQPGIYFLRELAKCTAFMGRDFCTKDKGERHGHSIGLIKTDDDGLLVFEPNYGGWPVRPEEFKAVADKLIKACPGAFEAWIYRVECDETRGCLTNPQLRELVERK